MDRAAHVGFALNVDELAAADARLHSNPRRLAERKTGEVVNHQTVDLADFFAFNVNHDGAVVDLLQHSLFNAVAAVNLGGNRLIDVLFADLFGVRFPRPVVGFAQKVAD